MSSLTSVFTPKYQKVFSTPDIEAEKQRKESDKNARVSLKILKNSFVSVVASHLMKIAANAQEKVCGLLGTHGHTHITPLEDT